MQTILCEKPDVRRKFEAALGGNTGQSPTVGDGTPFKVVNSVGHLFELKPLREMVDPRLVESFESWELKDLPFEHNLISFEKELIHKTVKNGNQFVRTVSAYHAQLFTEIQQALAQSDTIIIATDVDPSGEGDLLAWEIINAAGFKGRALRLKMVDDSANGILNAIRPEALREVTYQDPMVQSAIARQKFDFFTVQYSRATTTLPREHSVLQKGAVVRTGRLKSAMTEIIGSREEAYETFVPSSEYELAYFDSDKRKFVKAKSDRFKTPALALANPSNLPDTSTIKLLSKDLKAVKPPNLYDLMDLSGTLAKKGHDTSTFMDTYSKMYEAQIVTYPRTEDTVITIDQLNDFRKIMPAILQLLSIDPTLVDINTFASKNLYNPKSKTEPPSHGANRPGKVVPQSLDYLKSFGPLGPAIYEECARQILASFAPDKINLVSVYSDQSDAFKHTVVEMQNPGWTRVFSDGDTDDETEDAASSKSHPTVGGALNLSTNEVKAVRPSLFTEHTLANMLKRYDIGTGSTRKSTFDDVTNAKLNRKLVKKDGARLRLTDLGKIAFVLMKGTLLGDITFTQNLNTFLNQIRKGNAKADQAAIIFEKMFNTDLPKIKDNAKFLSSFKKVAEPAFKRLTRVYQPTGQSITFTGGIVDYTYTESDLEKLLAGETIEVELKGKKSKALYIAVLKLADDPTYGWQVQMVDRKFAPRKQGTGVYQPTGETITFEATFSNKDLLDSEIQTLLSGGSIRVSGVSKKTGKPFTTDAVLAKLPPYNKPTEPPIWQVTFKMSAPKEKHEQVYIPTNNILSIPKVWSGHTFTTPELNTLFKGEPIVIETANGKSSIDLSLRDNYNAPGQAIQLGFYRDPNDFVTITPPGQTKPVTLSRKAFGHTLTDAELKTLASGDSISFTANKKAGGTYTAVVELTFGKAFNQTHDSWHVAFVPRDR